MLDSSRNTSESLKNDTNTLATMELKSLLKINKINSWSVGNKLSAKSLANGKTLSFAF